MNKKYITTQIRITVLSKKEIIRTCIHEELETTIAERKKILQQLVRFAKTVEMYTTTTQAA